MTKGAVIPAGACAVPMCLLTPETKSRRIVSEGQALGNPPTPAEREPGSRDPKPETGPCEWDSFSAPYLKIEIVNKTGLRVRSETAPLLDRCGRETKQRITRQQIDSLVALALVEVIGRRTVQGVRPKPGVSIAAINAALRNGIRLRIPVAEDNQTVARVSAAGGGVYHEHIRTAAWADGRED